VTGDARIHAAEAQRSARISITLAADALLAAGIAIWLSL
jgi:hypothetical protein